MRVGIVGGGIAGLVAGYDLSKAGAQVTILERERRFGGLARSFTVGPGQEIERYYHFICKPDRPYFDMLRELGLISHVHWTVTEMGLFYDGAIHTLGDPLSLLQFPYLSVSDKARFAWSTALAKLGHSSGWKALESTPAREWLVQCYGERTYDMLYSPLLNLKFHGLASKVSAAWMWARLHRLGNSRTLTQKEHLAYLKGGTQVYIDALEQALHKRGADLHTSAPVENVVIEEGCAVGVQCEGEQLRFDCVLSTVPIPCLTRLLADANGLYLDNLRQLEYIDVLSMVMRLRHRFSKYFWVNISDPEIGLAGIIEYTNLNPALQVGGDGILYLPQYLPSSSPLCTVDSKDLFDLYCKYLHKMNPAFEPDWVRDYWVHDDRFAQPICDLDFSKRIPPIHTPIGGLYLTDSYQLHPDDRTIAGSTDLGRKAAGLILAQQAI